MPGHPEIPLMARRRLLQAGGAGLALAGLGCTRRAPIRAEAPLDPSGYGPLRPVADANTGLPLLQLPEGFSYTSFGWVGEPLVGGQACPRNHDGMGVVAARGDVLTLIRNHEISTDPGGSFAPPEATYDPDCRGGTVTLRFDVRAGRLLEMRPSLSGTLVNCAGGVTPWGSWLSCEEVVLDANQLVPIQDQGMHQMKRAHGYVFEVPADGLARPEPLLAMGRMKHEAATVDPATGIVYMTEDQKPAGFYRFIANVPGQLVRGGRLQMLQAVGVPDLRTGRRQGEVFKVRWVEIEEPDRGFDADGGGTGVVRQGQAGGGSLFSRLEGVVIGDGRVLFTSTNGGDAGCGQLWAYRPGEETLELVFESPSPEVLDYPDNIVLSPRGGLVICEDSEQPVQRLYGMAVDGSLFEFARNNIQLDGYRDISGDFRGEEWAGACFSADGRWLFANNYRPGITFAITGPWRSGLV